MTKRGEPLPINQALNRPFARQTTLLTEPAVPEYRPTAEAELYEVRHYVDALGQI